ncbi:hypothetical protein AYL99_07106 [Fonsecaea erecta]|uniref:Post-SET domain-containing protein n=1 Tax=Fonsecaea erecta TaxID=1367422 RepID=A0A178ZEV9_9EURO|nr:hypothetical protein AYL99_07106 [Fonsecaea erecta]OAP58016.1 hypothetical protein AYL99_07106 [Fonsecaea erecta]
MPPANSPSDTRPSTPPNTYLRQLEEAIATPVPDLASTLNLNSSDSDSQNEQRPNRPRTQASQLEGFLADHDVIGTHGVDHWLNARQDHQDSATMEAQDERVNDRSRRMSTGSTEENPMFTRRQPPDSTNTQDPDDSDADMASLRRAAARSTDTDTRTLYLLFEAALQRVRSSRRDRRNNADGGALIRAWNNGEADDEITVTPGYVTGHRRELSPRHFQNGRQPNGSRHGPPAMLRRSDAFRRVRRLIRYLSQLRRTGIEGGLEAARKLGLDSLYALDDSNAPSDLPMHINSLPVPQYSSWLQAGMAWHGLQSTEREPLRGLRHEAFEGDPMATTNPRREIERQLLQRIRDRRRDAPRGGINETAESEVNSQALVTVETYLSDLERQQGIGQDSAGRWSFSLPRSLRLLSSNTTQTPSQYAEPDHWPVKVMIHSVDWEAMTLTGIMSASQMPEKLPSLHQSDAPPLVPATGTTTAATTSMSSFFVGEIIDFRRQPLETEQPGRDYEVGGLSVDARYWQRLGPFRKEIERVRHLRGKKRSEYQQSSALWEAFRKAAGGGEGENKDTQSPSNATSPSTGNTKAFETPEDKEADDDEVMARCLGSAKWIEEKLGKEWILMRWKERCFVTPPGSSTNSRPMNANATRTIFTTTASRTGRTTGRGPGGGHSNASTSWGLTIAGYYYIALNRLTGEIDGLYYDPGSQPFQTIKMVPEGTRVARAQACGCGEQDCREPVGVKKWFPAVEVR